MFTDWLSHHYIASDDLSQPIHWQGAARLAYVNYRIGLAIGTIPPSRVEAVTSSAEIRAVVSHRVTVAGTALGHPRTPASLTHRAWRSLQQVTRVGGSGHGLRGERSGERLEERHDVADSASVSVRSSCVAS